jgi:predicted nucleic acid-binding protein
MKKLFPGYFRPDETEVKQIWSEGLIALDANVLLNLYRYSDETREEFLKILNLFEDKLILPKWAAQEFFSHRLDVIVEQEGSYEETLAEIKKLEEKFANTRHHPFLSQRLLSRLARLFRDVTRELKERQERYFEQVNEDPLLLKLNQIFGDRILSGFSKGRLVEIGKEGQPRYSAKIPPGYLDERKSEDGDLRKFGDFFV